LVSAPCVSAEINLEMVHRVISACESGVMINLRYVNLQGVINNRTCHVHSFRREELFMFVIAGDFGFRTVCLERVLDIR
jgi:hypothetical protein